MQGEFAIPAGEIVEMGILLLQPDGVTLELTFRGGGSRVAQPGDAVFSGHPDRPTGVAGRVLVSGDVVRVQRSDPLHDYGLEAGSRPASPHSGSYEGIISAPLIDWQAGGIPLGVVYLTTATVDGRLFSLPSRTAGGPAGQSLDDLIEWLHLSALGALSVLRKMGRTG